MTSALSLSPRQAVQRVAESFKLNTLALDTHPDPLGKLVDALNVDALFCSAEAVFAGLAHLSALRTRNVVLHVEVDTDFAPVVALKSLGVPLLQSYTVSDAEDVAAAAYLYSEKHDSLVVHFYARNVVQPAEETSKWTVDRVNKATDDFAETELTVFDALKLADVDEFTYSGSKEAVNAIILFGDGSKIDVLDSGLLLPRVYSPFDANKVLKALPPSVTRIAVLEQVSFPKQGFLPLFEDLHGADNELLARYKISSARINASTSQRSLNFAFTASGDLEGPPTTHFMQTFDQQAFDKDDVYLSVLNQVFSSLNLLNDTASASSPSPEYAFGRFLALEERRAEVVKSVRNLLANNAANNAANTESKSSNSEGSSDIVSLADYAATHSKELAEWTLNPRNPELVASLPVELRQLFESSDWIVGSDAWSFDVGMSGVHHVLTSNRNVNMLVLESLEHGTQKRDIGLHAMTLGSVYVASTAVYGGYTQLLQALLEASEFNGPSVVVAYLPEGTDAVDVLKKTKLAVNTGIWPLYRYNGEITLDSYILKQSLKEFLDRDQKLTLLAKSQPQLARALLGPVSAVKSQQQLKAEQEYAKLLAGLSGPPVQILFASDGGQAESVAVRLGRRAQSRGLKATVCAFDAYEGDLAVEPHVVFITSTAGQGELPQNGRQLWELLKTQLDLAQVKFAVFGMGDSEYWPRKQDAKYYNKPSKDLYNRLIALGAEPLTELGQGDDQDADGWSTGYNAWEPELWDALGVSGMQSADDPPPLTNEDMKRDSNYLRGTIAEELKDQSTGSVCAVSQQLTKFHGLYMQDDRDIRDARKAQGMEPAYSFMARVRLPGCVSTPEQWLAIDRLSTERGNGTIKITTRGTFQLHGIIKEDLRPTLRGINAVLLDTVAACGDVNRTVVGSASVYSANVHNQIVDISNKLSEHLLPRTTAYYEIWLEGHEESDPKDYEKIVNGRKCGPTKKRVKHLVSQSPPLLETGEPDEEPLYSNVYLPRKFKINIAVPPVNDVDVYAHDVGLIAIVENNSVTGFNLFVGGGMGTTHNNKKTYPRLNSLMGYVPFDEVVNVVEKVMLVQRDFGDRTNRKHARLKYTVDDLTVDGFKEKLETYLGSKLQPAREHIPFKNNTDVYGWVRDELGFNHFTTFVENGRVEDTPTLPHRTGFRKAAEWMIKNKVGEFRLTANQHIIVAAIPDNLKPELHELLAQYKLDNISFSNLRLASQACVAFPTCGLAMAESERYLPVFVTKLEAVLEDLGLKHDSVVLRMTGCPNGCARPWVAEIALVGKAFGAYNLMLGGTSDGSRLNKLYRSSLREEEVLEVLTPMLKSWALEREENEPFGDFVIRKNIISATREGKDWWENVEPGLV